MKHFTKIATTDYKDYFKYLKGNTSCLRKNGSKKVKRP